MNHGPSWIKNTKNVLHNMELLLSESNKSINIQIFYYYVLFKEIEIALTIDSSSVKWISFFLYLFKLSYFLVKVNFKWNT